MAFISVQNSHKSLSGIDLPVATTTITPTSDTTTLYKNPNIGFQTNDVFASATNISLSTANPLGIPFGAHYRHHFWTEFETVEGVRDFTALLTELDQCHAEGQVMNLKISEQEPESGFQTPTFAYNYSGWIADYAGVLNQKYAYFGDSRVLNAWFNFWIALWAQIKNHPALGMIDAGWGAYMENTYSGTAIVSINGGAPGTVGQEIPALTDAQNEEYYNRWTNAIPANKLLCYPEVTNAFTYATATRKTGVRADSWGYRSAATVQCTDSAGANYGKQFMCRTYAQTFAGVETVDTPYTASNSNAWRNAPLALETWDFFYKFTVSVTRTPVTIDTGADTIGYVAHGFSNGDTVRIWASTTMPAPLLSNTTYYVVGTAADTFQVSLTNGGAAIDITSAGAGTISAYKGTDSSSSWVGGNWDYANSFNWAISNHASVFNVKGKFDVPTAWVTRTQTLLRSCGYRYRVTSFSYPTTILAGKVATITSIWRNNGNAPHYGDAVIGYRLRETTTNLKYYLTNHVACNFLPYATVGDTTIEDKITLPSYLPGGIYELSVGAIKPKGKFGYLKLAMSTPADDGARYYPMGNMVISNPSPTTNTENLSAHFDGTTLQYGKVTNNYSISVDGGLDWCMFVQCKFDDISDNRVILSRGDPGNVTAGVTQFCLYHSIRNFTFDNTTDTVTNTSHNYANDDRISFFTTSGTLPTGISASTSYYVINRTANTFQISLTSGGAAVNFTTDGSGTISANSLRMNLVDSSLNSVIANLGPTVVAGTLYNLYIEYTASSGVFSIKSNDGATVSATLSNPIQTVTTEMRLGVDKAGIRLMSGNISQAYIWKGRKLTSGEQTTFYNSGKGTYVPELTETQRANLYWALYTGRSELQDGWSNHDLTNVGGVTFT